MSVEQFRVEVDRFLDVLTARLIEALKPIAKRRYPKNVFLLMFEVELQDFSRGFPVARYALDKDNGEVDLGEVGGLLSDVTSTIPRELLERKEYIDADIETWEVAYDVLAHWFSRCWIEAGGEKCSRRALMAIHDGGEYFDLNLGKVVTDEDVWGEAQDNLPSVPKPEESDFERVKAPKVYAGRVADAFQNGDADALRAVIAEGWNVNSGPYRADMTLLELMANSDDMVDLAQVLIDNGARLGSSLAMAERGFAFDGGNPKMVELLRAYAEAIRRGGADYQNASGSCG